MKKDRASKTDNLIGKHDVSLKVSVVVPLYNQEDYLDKALHSLATQTLKEMEFIIVNDGSTDSSLAIAQQYAEADPRFKIIDKTNSGYGHTMNVGIDAANGEYMGILEPDDCMMPEMYEKLYQIAKANRLDIVVSDFYHFATGDNDEIVKQTTRLTGDHFFYNRLIKPVEEQQCFRFEINTRSGIYRLEWMRKWNIRYNESSGASFQDIGFFFQTFCRAERVWFWDRAFYLNRRDNRNLLEFHEEKNYAITEEYRYIYHWLEQDPELLENVKSIFYLKKLDNYLVTYRKIDAEYKEKYLIHMAEEFKPPVEEGILNGGVVTQPSWDQLNAILQDPVGYYKRIQVSVIIPAYNVENYIAQCLDSILLKDDLHMEVICVDDGSTDNTLRILKDYESRDYRVKVITQKNAGAGAARNNGMKYANGEYLAFFDADDFFEPEVLFYAYDLACREKSDIVVFRSDDYIEETGEFSPIPYSIHTEQLPDYRPFPGSEIEDNIFEAFVGWPWDKLFRSQFVKENHLVYQEQRTTNDALFVFSAIIKADRISIREDILAHHRRHGSGKSLSVSREKSWDCFYSALLAIRAQLKEWGLYERREKDFINYSLNFSLWHLNTLKGEAYHRLYQKLKEEWFAELGVLEKPEKFFYFNDKYENLKTILRMDSDEYLHFRIDQEQAAIDMQKKELERLCSELKEKDLELERVRRRLASEQQKYCEIKKTKSYRIGRAITLPYRYIRDNRIKKTTYSGES